MNLKQIAILMVIIGSLYWTSALSNNNNLCSRGPEKWCKNIRNARQCHAVRHCIQTIWEKHSVPDDNDFTCNICLDMMKEGREQLESNGTQSDLNAVIEGSCRLVWPKSIQEECIKLADFIPELMEILSFEVSPEVVCSIVGLCKNAQIDEIMNEPIQVSTLSPLIPTPSPSPYCHKHRALSCDDCYYVSSIISTKFKIASRDDMLESILSWCGHTSSFSDTCSNIVLTYFTTFYNFFKEKIDGNGLCHLPGTCVDQNQGKVVVQNLSSRSSMDYNIPCELCQQLVHHLKDMLIANTTELEFKQILEGLCQQTKAFKSECLSYVEKYHDQIYHTLISNLDANGSCFLIGVCPKRKDDGFLGQSDITPLIRYIEPAKINVKLTKLESSSLPVYTNEKSNSTQMPIHDLLTVPRVPVLLVNNGENCTLCEFFLHFLRHTLAFPATEAKIKEALPQVCVDFPTSLRGSCHNFVAMYGDAVVGLMLQNGNLSEICLKIKLCSKIANNKVSTINRQKQDKSGKPKFPLCFFALKRAQELIGTDKTKQNIETVLDNLCNYLPSKRKSECIDFVRTYLNELIKMLTTESTPREICDHIKLCTLKHKSLDSTDIRVDGSENVTTEVESVKFINPMCLLCKEVVSKVEKFAHNATKADIKKDLYEACDKMHSKECHKFIDKYGDDIALLILLEMKPYIICKEIGMCPFFEYENLGSSVTQIG